MDNEDALKIIQALSDGVDPTTGEVLPNNSPYQTASITQALDLAIKGISYKIKSDSLRSHIPSNAGKSWSKEEDQQASGAFDAGKTIAEIANDHKRTCGAIHSRLVKLGKIELVPDFETKTDMYSDISEKEQKTGHECIDCGSEIPEERVNVRPGVIRCVHCLERQEERSPSITDRKVDEGIAGTREENKRNCGRQRFDSR